MNTEQPTKAEWEEIEKKLDSMFSPVYLECDGYLVRLALERVGKMKLGITVFVDGRFLGAWFFSDDDSEEGRRFFPTRSRSLYRGKMKKLIRQTRGKAAAEKKLYSRDPVWSSFNSLRRHLVKHNDRIRVLTSEQHKAAVEEKERAQEI